MPRSPLCYSATELYSLRELPLSRGWPSCLSRRFLNDGSWDPERWHAKKRLLRGFLQGFLNQILRGGRGFLIRMVQTGLGGSLPGHRPELTNGRVSGMLGRVGIPGEILSHSIGGFTIPTVCGRGRYGGGIGPNYVRGTRVRCLRAIARSDPHCPSRTPGCSGLQDPGLRLVSLNARSVVHKAPLIYDLIQEGRADLACITETWLGHEGGVPLMELCPPGFRAFHRPRAQGRGGGVAVVIRESLGPQEVTVPQIGGCESLFVKWGLGVQVGLFVTYLSPCYVSSALPELLDVLAGLAVDFPRLMILGDFNLPSIGETSESAREFMASMTAMDLTQLIQDPTHNRGHTLDLVFVSGQWMNDLDLGDISIQPLSWSDHFLLRLDFHTATPRRREVEPIRWFRPRRLMDPERFLMELGTFPESLAHSSTEALVEAWDRAATGALDRVVPLRPLTRYRSRVAPWFTEELREMKRRRRRLESGWRASRSESDRTLVRTHIKSYLVAIKAAKRQHFSALIASADNCPAALFRVTRSLLNQGTGEDPLQGRAEEFAQYLQDKISQIRTGLDSDWVDSGELTGMNLVETIWDEFDPVTPEGMDRIMGRLSAATCVLDPCPSWLVSASREVTRGWLQAITNASLREGLFPTALKEAVVRPLLKKPSLDPASLANYRPVSNLRFIAKVVESVVARQLPQYLDEAAYLDPFQSGFRPGYSTETALVALVDDLWRARDRGSSSVLVLLDLSAAFDTIDHGILLRRLGGLGVGGTVLRWFSSYLSDRSQFVLTGGQGSTPRRLTCGVPQGSVLSPLLFNIYMKPLGEIIRGFGVQYHQYADDTQLFISTPNHPNDALDVMFRCLEAVRIWMGTNRLKLNPSKTEWLWFPTSRFVHLVPSLMIGGEILAPSERARNLGVLLDTRLSLEEHLTAVTRGAFYQVRLVRQLRPFLDRDALCTVTHALVLSRLDYCNALYMGLPLKSTRRLQLVQNAAARVIMGVPRCSHVTPLLGALHWLPVVFRVRFKVLIMIFKALHGLGPGYLRDHLLPPVASHRPVRSHRVGLLRVPSARQCRLATPRGRAFSVGAPSLWNELPPELRIIPDLRSFRRALKSWLFQQAGLA